MRHMDLVLFFCRRLTKVAALFTEGSLLMFDLTIFEKICLHAHQDIDE